MYKRSINGIKRKLNNDIIWPFQTPPSIVYRPRARFAHLDQCTLIKDCIVGLSVVHASYTASANAMSMIALSPTVTSVTTLLPRFLSCCIQVPRPGNVAVEFVNLPGPTRLGLRENHHFDLLWGFRHGEGLNQVEFHADHLLHVSLLCYKRVTAQCASVKSAKFNLRNWNISL